MSALGNVLVLRSPLPAHDLMGYLNHTLSDIHVHSHARVEEDFDPRRAGERWYRYLIPGFPGPDGGIVIPAGGRNVPFDLDRARGVLALFEGEHDLSRFCCPEPGRNPVRRILSTGVTLDHPLRGGPPFVCMDIRGESFLRMMVRYMVGAVIGVLAGSLREEDVVDMLEHPAGDTGAGGGEAVAPDAGGTGGSDHGVNGRNGHNGICGLRKPTPAPPERLLLMDVSYPSVRFLPGPAPNHPQGFLAGADTIIPWMEFLRHLP